VKIFALTYEYSYANNDDGNQSPDEAGGILGLYEDRQDAEAQLKVEQESGDWGVFSDEVEDNDGWSSGGYILSVEEQEVIPSSKRKD
jgi:hypothetical protein